MEKVPLSEIELKENLDKIQENRQRKKSHAAIIEGFFEKGLLTHYSMATEPPLNDWVQQKVAVKIEYTIDNIAAHGSLVISGFGGGEIEERVILFLKALEKI